MLSVIAKSPQGRSLLYVLKWKYGCHSLNLCTSSYSLFPIFSFCLLHAATFVLFLRFELKKHAEILIPQHAGSVLIFTPPGTPRRDSGPCIDSSQLTNGHAGDVDQPKVESEVHLMRTPQDFDFGAVELTIPSPFVNGEVPDLEKEAALQRMNDITGKLIESEEKYLDDLRSLVEVWSLLVLCNQVMHIK